MSHYLRTIVYKTHQALTLAYETELAKAKVDLTGQQSAVLEAIQNLDGPSQTNLVDATGIDRSTMAYITQRLVNKGFVSRKKSRSDARRYILALTDKGKEATLRAAVIANRLEASIALQRPTAIKGLEGKLQSVIEATKAASGGNDVALVAAE